MKTPCVGDAMGGIQYHFLYTIMCFYSLGGVLFHSFPRAGWKYAPARGRSCLSGGVPAGQALSHGAPRR